MSAQPPGDSSSSRVPGSTGIGPSNAGPIQSQAAKVNEVLESDTFGFFLINQSSSSSSAGAALTSRTTPLVPPAKPRFRDRMASAIRGLFGSTSVTPYRGGGPNFSAIDSSKLQTFPSSTPVSERKDFLKLPNSSPPPIIGKSRFVSGGMVEHLMRDKKDSACNVKYEEGDRITNMEGALHTFVTPVCDVLMTGDCTWAGKVQGAPFGNNQVRNVILSAAVQPDFENDTVMMPLVRVREEAVEGTELSAMVTRSEEEKTNRAAHDKYEEDLLKHMVYSLSQDHRIPALSEIRQENIMDQEQAQLYLEELITTDKPHQNLKGKFMRVGEEVISLEILFRTYIEQIRNEFNVLNMNATQGYIYTIDPPSIFARGIGGPKGAAILNRLQALAFKELYSPIAFSGLKVVGFNDYADKAMVGLLQQALPDVRVIKKSELYNPTGAYIGDPGLALVIHNNSDAFGQNIETERTTSMDGVIGTYSNAACALKRDRPDLIDHIV
ncbi:MAG: hypothetical protein JSS61_01850 [Verrucomicrobia bacterium]|nr:hypothetical protein [Verrucomicrobiota bacterium]